MKLAFYGAASEVTGSNFMLESEKYKIMVDCGLFQGVKLAEEQNYAPLPFQPKDLSLVLLTHAHLDHCGRIPLLWKEGFRGKIYATPATRDLAELIMNDAANIMLHDQEDDGQEPLYLAVDVAGAMNLFVPIEYNEVQEILPGVKVEFFDAGHILGAASILVEVEGKKILFSGDIGNDPVPILRPPSVPKQADVVVMESTYGNRLHESGQDRRAKLRAVIRQSALKKGILLIPAFALERTQELLYEINSLIKEESIPSIAIFLDSPLAIKTTKVYYQYERYFDDDAKIILKNGGDLFQFPNLTVTESVEESKNIAQAPNPKIIIAGSGMMEGGRIVHHAKDYLADPSTTLLIVGFQAQGTLGRKLFQGDRKVKVKGKFVQVKAHVVAIGAYSAHADQLGLRTWLGSLESKPNRVFLVHGEQESALDLANLLSQESYTAEVPTMNQVIDL